MKVKNIIIIAIIFLFSCKTGTPVKYEKPFVIISKSYGNYTGTGKQYQYHYQDKNGNQNYSYSVTDVYKLGDTIK